MISAQEIQGKWNIMRGKVKEKWGQLTDDDLTFASGNVDQLVGRIQQRTGEARQKIEGFLNDLMHTTGGVGAAVRERAEDFAHKAREGYEQVSDMARQGYRRAERVVQDHPATSIASVFVGGMLTGLCLGMLLAARSDR
jgi:uncharacterized protein YjbJ (UPF0337 family)